MSEERAVELAKGEMGSLSGVRTLASLRTASVGKPVLVRDLRKEPSYWLVPFIISGKAAGFARVLGDGKVAHIGAFGAGDTRKVVTGIDAPEARRVAAGRISPEKGETLGEPVFVHDGPIGREAWLVEALKGGRPTRWIFIVSPSAVYERPAGEMPGTNE